jgi:hypothetical protein
LALAKAQGTFPEIERNRTVKVVPRSGGAGYSFKYATFSAILAAVRKPLADNGLAFTQIISHDSVGGFYVLTTTLYHGNQFIASKVPLIAEGGSNQQFGSALTYMKRYAFAAMLGISADEDDDANEADGNTIVAMQDKAPKAPKPDVITTGVKPPPNTVVEGNAAVLNEVGYFNPNKIDVQLMPDDSASDWMTWGKTFIAEAKNAPSAAALKALEENNSVPLANMKISVPKMYDNMTLALIKVRNNLKETV